jgi:hypothetical protein
MTKLAVIIAFLVFFPFKRAQAACAAPAGVAGQATWIAANSVVKYCNGTNWIDTSVATGASCAGTTAGTIKYLTGDLQFCNGTNWITMKSSSLGGSGGTAAGTFKYDSATSTMQVSNGTNWYSVGTSTYLKVDAIVNFLSNTDVSVIDFGTGSGSADVTITNTGTASANISTVTITGGGAASFSISAQTCTGATLAPTQSCTFTISFTSSCAGADLNINGSSPKIIFLTGIDGVSC